jgi:hypothetical protein
VRFIDAASVDTALNMNEPVLFGGNVIVKPQIGNLKGPTDSLMSFPDWTVEHSVADILRPIQERRRVWVTGFPVF